MLHSRMQGCWGAEKENRAADNQRVSNSHCGNGDGDKAMGLFLLSMLPGQKHITSPSDLVLF